MRFFGLRNVRPSAWLDLHLLRRCGAPCATTEPQRRVPIHSTTECICYRNSHGHGYERIVPRAAPYEIRKAIAWFAVRIPASRSAGRTHGPISTLVRFRPFSRSAVFGCGGPAAASLPPSHQRSSTPVCMLSDLTSARDASVMLVIRWPLLEVFPHGPRFSPLVLRMVG